MATASQSIRGYRFLGTQQARLIRTAREVNDSMPQNVLKKIRAYAVELNSNGPLRPGIACLGLTYKPDVNDIRESPALAISEEISRWGDCDVFIAEPHLQELPGDLAGKNHVIMTSASEAIAARELSPCW